MRIAIIVPFYSPSIGGVETVARDTAEELSRRGHDVSVITTIYNNTWTKIAKPGVEVRDNVTIYRLNSSMFKIGYATLMNGLKETLIRIKPDIVHSHNLHPHLFQSAKWKDYLGYKIVAQLHCPEATGIDHACAKLLYKWVVQYLIKNQHRIDAFIAHTNLERKWLINKGVDWWKIHKVNYPCVRSSLTAYEPKPICRIEFPEKFVLMYMGRITWRKGIHTLLQAMPDVVSEIGNVRLVIAGSKNEEYYKVLLKFMNKLKLNHYVSLKQRLPEHIKYDYMGSCTAFVLPSIKDYTPVTLIEAQALGVPVVSTFVGAIPEIVRNRETGLLVEPENSKQLAQVLKRLLLKEHLRSLLSVKARMWVKNNFLLENTVSKLNELYTSCLNY